MGKKINELNPITDAQVLDVSRLFASCDAATGISGRVNMSQMKTLFGVYSQKYIAAGTEGTTISPPALAGKIVLMVSREMGIIYSTAMAPESTEYVWDGTTFTFGTPLNPGERLNIIYTNA